jgi:uncharacterized metal-binding protein YceD (DUF177 family)
VDNELVIYIDRLVDGKMEETHCMLPPDFMEIEETDLQFVDPIEVKGTFYTTPDHLVGTLQVKTFFKMPCSICDDQFSIPIEIHDLYITEPLENIPSGLYYPQQGIREAILLEAPSFYECNDGNCPNRMVFATIMKQKNETEKTENTKSYLPFKDLE